MSATETMIAPEPVEAVIISGPRKGEIIRVPSDHLEEQITDAEIQVLNEALDNLNAKLDSVSREIKGAVAVAKP